MAWPVADWEFWSQKTKAYLWECVALSLNYDPHEEICDDAKYGLPPKIFDQFSKRLAIAGDYVSGTRQQGKILTLTMYMGGPTYNLVDLREFAAWANGMKWEVPSQLVALGAAPPASPKTAISAPDDKPLSEKERNNLLRIIAALNAVILGDICDRHPGIESQAALIKLLKDKYETSSGISKSNLERVLPLAKRVLDGDYA